MGHTARLWLATRTVDGAYEAFQLLPSPARDP
jgi:hypothetical protein